MLFSLRIFYQIYQILVRKKVISKMLNPDGKILIYTHYGTSNL